MDNLNFNNWPFWAVIVYLIVTDVVPRILKALSTFTDKILPGRDKRKGVIEAAEIESEKVKEAAIVARQTLLDQAAMTREIKLDNIQDRGVAAQEKFAATLGLMVERQSRQEALLETVATTLAGVTQALTILLDRIHRNGTPPSLPPTEPPSSTSQ